MKFLRLILLPRYVVLTLAIIGFLFFALVSPARPEIRLLFNIFAVIFALLSALGIYDLLQTRHAVLRNYPISGHLRFMFEEMRPEIRQYFFEDDKSGTPFNRDQRAIVYQRAKQADDTRAFGTEMHVYAEGYEWAQHSMMPTQIDPSSLRLVIGEKTDQPYSSSLLNISAMSFGALSPNAIRALNAAAKLGCFAHDTGEGGISDYHRENGGDLIWEIGSGYFGCRDVEGKFSPQAFAAQATDPQIKMIEVKLSQGAKPGHGGVLPAAKVTPEIARIRGVPLGVDCISPARHSAFSTPLELVKFLESLRQMSGGKPVGFKFCVGHKWEFLAICKAMLVTGITPDFIVIDGKEGGTGAAPLEFMDHMGAPLREGLNFVHNALRGVGLRDQIKLGASGKIITAFDFARALALGADWCNMARGFMFSIGCIQSQSCNSGHCPTGVATQDPSRWRALVVDDKKFRAHEFHRGTLEALAEFAGAMGLEKVSDFKPIHFAQRSDEQKMIPFAKLYPELGKGALLDHKLHDPRFAEAWAMARPESFAPLN